MGNSFSGIEALLGARRLGYCAAVDASGGAESWAQSPELRDAMTKAVRQIPIPVLFFQAKNDYDVASSITLHKEMVEAGKAAEINLYPAYGSSDRDGHSFAYRGISVWQADAFRFLDTYCGAARAR